uniref:DUF1980 domain-containing protein n=2 Tax=Bursaphelenchus xylophilus TaxID=6326 RepID=A0A1I7SPQ8_BURXY
TLFLIITLYAMGESIAMACSHLLGDLRIHTTEAGQEKNTSAGKRHLMYLMVLSFIASVYFYLFYIVWRDYKFVKEYPRKKKVVESTESEKLLN